MLQLMLQLTLHALRHKYFVQRLMTCISGRSVYFFRTKHGKAAIKNFTAAGSSGGGECECKECDQEIYLTLGTSRVV